MVEAAGHYSPHVSELIPLACYIHGDIQRREQVDTHVLIYIVPPSCILVSFTVWIFLLFIEEGFALAQKTKGGTDTPRHTFNSRSVKFFPLVDTQIHLSRWWPWCGATPHWFHSHTVSSGCRFTCRWSCGIKGSETLSKAAAQSSLWNLGPEHRGGLLQLLQLPEHVPSQQGMPLRAGR